MADMCDTCGDGVVELLRKILEQERDSFNRLFQINESIASGDLTTENSNLTGINGVAPSVGCGVSDAGTLRVAPATNCTAPVNVAQVAGTATSVGNGTADAGTIRVTMASDSTGSSLIQGNVAHDAVDAGNPVKIGSRAIAHGTNPTAVAAGDRTDNYANRAGIPFVIGGHPNVITLEAEYTAAQTDVAIVTVGAGAKIVVTAIGAVCDHANTVDVGFRIGFGAATTPTTTGVVLTHGGVAAGSGYNRGDGSGMLGVGADGEDLRITSEVPTTGSLRVLVTYFTIES